MRRMVNINTIVKKPKLYFEEEILNASEVHVELPKGYYLVELHQQGSTNIALLGVGEEAKAVSEFTLFNAGVVGTTAGCFEYDTAGNLLELVDHTENIITVSGHIDIYRF